MAFKNRESALGISKLETIQTNKQTKVEFMLQWWFLNGNKE